MLLHKKLEGYNLILASASPRRRQLLADCGIEFTLAEKFECDESFPQTIPCSQVAEYISTLKSNAYPNPLGTKDILLTADTVAHRRSSNIEDLALYPLFFKNTLYFTQSRCSASTLVTASVNK